MTTNGLKRFVIVHGIPSPYRLHLFDCLNENLASQGWILEVHFMDLCRGDRAHWNTDLDVTFKHCFWKNWKLPGKKGRFNPGLIRYLHKQKPEIVMFGGVWDSVTSIISIGLLRLPKIIGWYEANDLIPGKMDAFSVGMKKYLLSRLDWHAVPGQLARRFLKRIFSGKEAGFKISHLPNLVDEERFKQQDLPQNRRRLLREKFGVPTDSRVIFTPARLISKKGLPGFLHALKEVSEGDLHYFILGEGPLKEEIIDTIKTLGLEERVTLKHFIAYEEMPDIYAMSDVFCLPSLSDPNPLSIVEALHSGLPVLLSNQLGNFPEAMKEGNNGFSFDPKNKASVVDAIRQIAVADQATLELFGEASLKIAKSGWDSKLAIEKFLEPILTEYAKM